MAKPALAKVDLRALRETVARIEEGRANPASFEDEGEAEALMRLAFGVEAFDLPLGGGLALAALNEIRAPLTMDSGAASGFALALCLLVAEQDALSRPVLWISEMQAGREAGLAHAAGLSAFGLSPQRLVSGHPRKLEDALWMAEAALGACVFSAVILELRGNPAKFGLTESRRLHLKAQKAGLPLFLLRQAGEEEASSALARIRVEAAPARSRLLPDGSRLFGTIGHPVFHLVLEKSRAAAPFSLFLEWNANERQFYPAADSAASHARPDRPEDRGHSVSAFARRQDRENKMGRVLAFSRAS